MPTLKGLEAVLFDLDGTLIDTAPDFIRTLNAMRIRHQHPELAAADIRAQVSNGARAMLKLGFGVTEHDSHFEALRTEFLDDYLATIGELSTLFLGLDTLLRSLEAQDIPWGIVTNKPVRYAEPLLENMSLASRCAATVCPDHVQEAKPNPESILLACARMRVNPENTLYIGDHERDIAAGNRAYATTVAVTWGYTAEDEDIDAWGAHHKVHNAEELLSIINQYL